MELCDYIIGKYKKLAKASDETIIANELVTRAGVVLKFRDAMRAEFAITEVF